MTEQMTEQEELIAQDWYSAVQEWSYNSSRSEQQRDFVIGVSDLGTCSERVRRLMAGIPMTDEPDKLEAFIGTWVGTGVEMALKQKHPEWVLQATVETILEADGGVYKVTGHPDVIDPAGVVYDGKTVDGLEVIRREGPNQQQLFQRHIYAKAAFEGGLFDPSVTLDDVLTANVWIDRSGAAKEFFVHQDNYQESIVKAAAQWVDAVYYDHIHGNVSQKEPPRQWCAKACGHFRDCRQFDSDVEGLITDPSIIGAVELHQEGTELARQGNRMKDDAKAALEGVSGYTGKHQVRWIEVSASEPQVTRGRRAYKRLAITKL